MLVSDLNLHNNNNINYYYNLNCVIEEKTLELDMEEECKTTTSSSMEAIAAKVVDVEEGEISDTASVEEISEEDFNKQEEVNTTSTTAVVVAAEIAKVKDSNNAINSTNNSGINANNNGNSNQKSAAAGAARVWTMRDLYKYQISRNYAPGALYNLAWAQAVQNKPLDEVLIMEYPKSDDSNNKADLKQSGSEVSVNGENERIVIDVDDDVKEEGELEEGEIDLDSDVVMGTGDSNLEDEGKGVGKGSELQKRLDLIQRGFESVTVDDAEKSFREVCSRLQNLLDSLQDIFLEDSLSEKDKLIQLSMTAIQTVNSVFCSMNQNQKEQNRDIFSRVLDHITNQKPLLFSPKQLKEIEVMVSSLDSLAVSKNSEESDRNKETDVVGGVTNIDPDVASENRNQDLTYLKKCDVDAISVESLDQNGPRLSTEYSRSGNFKQRGVSLPLLDLHKDHDVDSLPSPTREAPPPILPIDRAFGMVRGVLKPEWPVPRGVLEVEKVLVHPYETDAVKAVSSYQQKFGRTSFFTSDKLPSPTPSEDGDNGDGDIGGEVSSTSVNRNVHPSSSSIMGKPPVSTIPSVDISSGQRLTNVGNFFPVTSGPIAAVKAPIVKTRDPRLRLASSGAPASDVNLPFVPVVGSEPRVEPVLETMNLRKQKPMEEPVLDGPALKRQRNELTDFMIAKDVQSLTGTGGWLEDRGTVGLQVSNSNHVEENAARDLGKLEPAATTVSTGTSAPSVTVNRSENLPMPSLSATASLQSLLKDIAVNPSIWMNIIKMEQQKSADPLKSSTQPPSSNSILGAVPFSNIALPKASVPGQKSTGILQTPPQKVMVKLQDESAKVRMKPRDPRRVLHGNNFSKGGSIGGDQNKHTSSLPMQEDHPVSSYSSTPPVSSHSSTPPVSSRSSTPPVSSHSSMPPVSSHSSTPPVSSHSSTAPDIGRQFMKNLKNIGDIMSVSQAAIVPFIPSTQPTQAHQGRLDKGAASESGNIVSGTTIPSEDVAVGPSRPQNSWGDVEHLFEGFDDKQKAAIQKERARRIEEQKKMFAARKLCLVLDLDHTLLNSAKFVEVDPVHDEMLRKKEEQDREKPQRHLFRFPHMGMWTKLRPGIWNFLEKASKLFELHLYTMGNKLYATEMAKLLDPKGELFAGRVISRGDDGDLIDGDERIPKSKDLEGVLGMESGVVIIDDSVRVWPHNKLNLIVVERYIYFPCSRRQFGLLGPSLLEIDHDERPEDGTLASSLAVIERIHQNFFAHRSLDEADVRNILAAEQRKILAGCRIVFSRVFPVGEANPHLHPLWQTAEQFGAVCTTQIDDQVTHVVANSLGTDKVNWALSTGRFVVHPGWVEASALLYRRANEHDFAIKP